MLVSDIGNSIKSRRKELGITQLTLSELSDVSVNTLYQLEKGKNNPSLKVLESLFEVLGLEMVIHPKSVVL